MEWHRGFSSLAFERLRESRLRVSAAACCCRVVTASFRPIQTRRLSTFYFHLSALLSSLFFSLGIFWSVLSQPRNTPPQRYRSSDNPLAVGTATIRRSPVMASQAMDLDQVGEHQNLPDVSFETQQQLEARQAMIDHPLRDNDHEGSSAKLPAPPPFRQPLAWYSGQAVGQPTRQPLPRPNSPPTTVVPHRGDKHDQEGATARGAYLTPPGNTGVPIESEHQGLLLLHMINTF